MDGASAIDGTKMQDPLHQHSHLDASKLSVHHQEQPRETLQATSHVLLVDHLRLPCQEMLEVEEMFQLHESTITKLLHLTRDQQELVDSKKI